MPDHAEIYRKYADQYDQLVSREDYQQRLLPALAQIIPLEGLTVVEFGAGTGRLTRLLAPTVRAIYAFDRAPAMLAVARVWLRQEAWLRQEGRRNWQVAVGEHRRLALREGVADLVISGWSVGYLIGEYPATWETELAQVLREMRRALRPGGRIILIETLGTGVEQPAPPTELLPYYAYLEAHGFQRRWLRTDYRFRDLAEGEALAEFFFGAAMVGQLQQDARGVILPECTGIWWARLDD